ncbi:hypothetical protein GW17_00035454 [Ensete ventricosum]|nr:hypothetical protein GW17_00035454 [Ensete ventricosum]
MVSYRRVFRVCASKLASDESLGHQHMRAVYHRGRTTGELDCFSAHIRLREPGKSEDKAKWSKGARKQRTCGAQLPKSKASIRKEVDSEEHYSTAEIDLPIAKEGMQMQDNG